MRCKDLNILSIDITKCASNSIRKSFREKFPQYKRDGEWVDLLGRHHSVRNFTAEGHRPRWTTAKWVCTCDVITEEDLKNYKTFAVIRNPYDRLVSLYLWGSKYYEIPFEKFITNIFEGVYQENNQHRYKTQYEWISDESDIVRVSRLLRLENLNKDFSELLTDWNLPQFKLYKKNTAKSRHGKERLHYREYYTEKSKEMATVMYERDLDYFKYTF